LPTFLMGRVWFLGDVVASGFGLTKGGGVVWCGVGKRMNLYLLERANKTRTSGGGVEYIFLKFGKIVGFM